MIWCLLAAWAGPDAHAPCITGSDVACDAHVHQLATEAAQILVDGGWPAQKSTLDTLLFDRRSAQCSAGRAEACDDGEWLTPCVYAPDACAWPEPRAEVVDHSPDARIVVDAFGPYVWVDGIGRRRPWRLNPKLQGDPLRVVGVLEGDIVRWETLDAPDDGWQVRVDGARRVATDGEALFVQTANGVQRIERGGAHTPVPSRGALLGWSEGALVWLADDRATCLHGASTLPSCTLVGGVVHPDPWGPWPPAPPPDPPPPLRTVDAKGRVRVTLPSWGRFEDAEGNPLPHDAQWLAPGPLRGMVNGIRVCADGELRVDGTFRFQPVRCQPQVVQVEDAAGRPVAVPADLRGEWWVEPGPPVFLGEAVELTDGRWIHPGDVRPEARAWTPPADWTTAELLLGAWVADGGGVLTLARDQIDPVVAGGARLRTTDRKTAYGVLLEPHLFVSFPDGRIWRRVRTESVTLPEDLR